MKTLIAACAFTIVAILAAIFAIFGILVAIGAPPTKHYAPTFDEKHQPAFQERFGDWDVDGLVQSKACRPKWPSWEVVCLA